MRRTHVGYTHDTLPASDSARGGVDTEVYLARQPILDTRGSVFGYELLYRGSGQADACEHGDDQATARVLIDAMLSLGFEALTDGRPASSTSRARRCCRASPCRSHRRRLPWK
ncbi:MAG: hypothetical protein QM736_17905 [Vicinamibacterales bacterium]